MSAARHGTASGTFKMAFSVAAFAFWKVRYVTKTVLEVFIYLYVGVILIYLKETVGLADKIKNAHLVVKERRCDPTFAYQQVMYDVSREILHYTSRWVYIMLKLVILFTNPQ